MYVYTVVQQHPGNVKGVFTTREQAFDSIRETHQGNEIRFHEGLSRHFAIVTNGEFQIKYEITMIEVFDYATHM